MPLPSNSFRLARGHDVWPHICGTNEVRNIVRQTDRDVHKTKNSALEGQTMHETRSEEIVLCQDVRGTCQAVPSKVKREARLEF